MLHDVTLFSPMAADVNAVFQIELDGATSRWAGRRNQKNVATILRRMAGCLRRLCNAQSNREMVHYQPESRSTTPNANTALDTNSISDQRR